MYAASVDILYFLSIFSRCQYLAGVSISQGPSVKELFRLGPSQLLKCVGCRIIPAAKGYSMAYKAASQSSCT